MSDEQRELYKAVLGRNYQALVGKWLEHHLGSCCPHLSALLVASSLVRPVS
jgi:hypothetical protein